MEEYSKERIQAEMKEAKEKYWVWGIASGILLGIPLFLLGMALLLAFSLPSIDIEWSIWDPLVSGIICIPGLLCYRKARSWKRKYEEWKSRL